LILRGIFQFDYDGNSRDRLMKHIRKVYMGFERYKKLKIDIGKLNEKTCENNVEILFLFALMYNHVDHYNSRQVHDANV
jgi:hypothetical protein